MTGRAGATRVVGAGMLVILLAACSPGPLGPGGAEPPAGPGPAIGPDCAAAFPGATEAPDLADAPTVPADWPNAPAGSTLCVVMQTSDINAVLQYVTTSTPDEVLDSWEPLLSGYELVRGDGIGDNPILNATGPGLEFAIQTDAGTSTYFVAFGKL